MSQKSVTIKKEDFERLLHLMDSGETGFPVLALHSVIEREIGNVTGMHYPYKFTFYELCRAFEASFKNNKQHNILARIKAEKEVTNGVRHAFKTLTIEEIASYATTFFNFVDEFDPSAKELPEYEKLKKSVDDVLNDVKKETVTIEEMDRLRKENIEAFSLRNDYNKIFKEKEELEAKLLENESKVSEIEKDYQKKKRDLDRKIDKLRREKYDIGEEKRSIEDQLKAYSEENADAKEQKRTLQNKLKENEKLLKQKDENLKKQEEEAKKFQEKYEAEIGKIQAQVEFYRGKLEETKPIMDTWLDEKRCFLYSQNRHDYLKSRRELTTEQKQVVESVSESADFLITGGAGSGKTFVLLEILNRLTQGRVIENKCRFLTYTNALTGFSNAILPDLRPLDNRVISTVDSFIYNLANKIFGIRIDYKDNGKGIITNSVKEKDKDATPQKIQDCIDEIRLFIWARNVKKEEYLSPKCLRRGMKEMKNMQERKEVWDILEIVTGKLENKRIKEWPYAYAVIKLLEEFENNPDSFAKYTCDYILVDEWQDLSLATLMLLKKLSAIAIYLAGDYKQSIYKKADFYPLEAGIKIQGRSRQLKECHRSTRQINSFAENYKKLAQLGREEKEELISFTFGPPVRYFEGLEAECLKQTCNIVSNLISLGTSKNNIAVIVYNNDQIDSIESKLNEYSIDTDIINEKTITREGKEYVAETFRDLIESDSVKILTIHNAKGLEFPYVIFYGVEGARPPYCGMSPEKEEEYRKSLVYVAITRANVFLYIVADNSKPSVAIKLIKEAIELPEETEDTHSTETESYS